MESTHGACAGEEEEKTEGEEVGHEDGEKEEKGEEGGNQEGVVGLRGYNCSGGVWGIRDRSGRLGDGGFMGWGGFGWGWGCDEQRKEGDDGVVHVGPGVDAVRCGVHWMNGTHKAPMRFWMACMLACQSAVPSPTLTCTGDAPGSG